nr:MAG TPA: hypothetical protein [Bacteriophage sp.]
MGLSQASERISPDTSNQIVSKAATQTSSIASAGAEETDSTRGRV